jgi:hypothetical protein
MRIPQTKAPILWDEATLFVAIGDSPLRQAQIYHNIGVLTLGSGHLGLLGLVVIAPPPQLSEA